MPDYTGFVKTIKRAALDAVEATKPVVVYYGTVKNESPLEIDVEQKMTLREAQLVLTKAVTDHWVDIQVSHVTGSRSGGGGYAEYASHNHNYKGRKKIMIYNGLKKDEEVLLIRFQGGQKFVVWDRVYDHTVKGEWL